MFERRDVWELSEENPWHPIIEWYARAVGAMQGRGRTDPASWQYLASIHGTECQHFSWYFLPWHRIYLHYFERVVRQMIADLDGPSDWALPYWDYSNPERPDVRKLPPAFRERRMPSGETNPLFVEERGEQPPDVNQGEDLGERDVSIGAAMEEELFTGPGGIAEFGGPATGWNHIGGTVGTLERTPHGNVHVKVGGLMGGFNTAGLDPIFWLHHANIDRLWEVWLGQGDRTNPVEEGWLDMEFTVGRGALAVTLRVREVLVSADAPLAYHYSDLSLPEPVRDAVTARFRTEARLARQEEPMRRDTLPEMVGASEDRVRLADTPIEVEVAVEPPSGPALEARAERAQPRKVYLKVENVTGKELTALNYLVYVDLPPGADPSDHDDRRVGQVPMFGVREASQTNEQHSGSGLTFSFDITGVVQHLQETEDWDPERLRVTFTPEEVVSQSGDVDVGRVSLFYA